MEYKISDRMAGMKGSAIREIFKYTANPEVISLAGGNPAPELFPNEILADLAKEILSERPVAALQYGVTEGYPELREQIKERLKRVENIGQDYDETIILTGGQQGMDLAAKCLVNEGDTILVEEPSFIGALNSFRAYRANLAGVKMDEDGMNMEALEEALQNNKNVRFIYTIPTFQNPSGVTMPVEKRRKMLELAKKYGVLILEDNPYGELTFNGVKTPTIKSMDTEGYVMYSSSFSKILAPGLRLGYFTAPKEIIARMVIAKQVSDVHTPCLTQILASEYLKRYDIDSAILVMRENYSHKCRTMLDAIEEYFPKDIMYTRPNGGLFIWCDLYHGIDTQVLSAKAVEKKVVYVPGATFMVDMDKPSSTLRLNYSTMSDERIVEGIRRLGDVFAEAIQ